jgi:hypothetical protein
LPDAFTCSKPGRQAQPMDTYGMQDVSSQGLEGCARASTLQEEGGGMVAAPLTSLRLLANQLRRSRRSPYICAAVCFAPHASASERRSQQSR